jgi:SAM-dependent methyltransferase
MTIESTNRILEVGCGGGQAVGVLCHRLQRGGSVVAIDRSAIQAERAGKRNDHWIAKGCARVAHASLAEAPEMFGQAFDKVLAINVNEFWTSPAASFECVRRLLKATGTLYLVYEPPSERQGRVIAGVLAEAAAAHGFAIGAVRETRFRSSMGIAVAAVHDLARAGGRKGDQ